MMNFLVPSKCLHLSLSLPLTLEQCGPWGTKPQTKSCNNFALGPFHTWLCIHKFSQPCGLFNKYLVKKVLINGALPFKAMLF